MSKIFISGNTYPVKDKLKQLGCRWDAASRSWYAETEEIASKARETVSPTPLYNSPPPVDLGTVDPIALAAKFNRKAVGGAAVKSFDVYGLSKGDDGAADGTIHTIKGKRFLQVARTSRRYLSRDFLDDCDIFGEQPGGSYQWDGVEVEPTEAEAAADRAEEDRKAIARQEKDAAAAKAKAEQEARKAVWDATIVGLTSTTAAPVGFTPTSERLPISDGNGAIKIQLADGRFGWQQNISGGDDWRTYYYLPSDVVRAANLAQAAASGITPEKAAEWLVKYSGCYGAEIYRAAAEATDEEKEALCEFAKKKAQDELARGIANETRSTNSCAETAIKKLGLPLAGFEVIIDQQILAAFCQARENRQPAQLTVELVLRLAEPAYTATGKIKAAVARNIPETIKLHNFCTATVRTEKAQA